MAKRKKTSKLIGKTPLLFRKPLPSGREMYWTSAKGKQFLCCNLLGQLFTIPKKTKQIRAYLWSDSPGKDAQFVRIALSNFRWQPSRWTTSQYHEPGHRVSFDALEWLKTNLFRGCTKAQIKSAWLEIEIED